VGGLLCALRENALRIVYAGAIVSIVACGIGALIHLVGGHGILYGVADPVAILLLLRATPPADRLNTDERNHCDGNRKDGVAPLTLRMA